MADVREFLGGSYLAAADVEPPLRCTIRCTERRQLEGKQRLAVCFHETDKQLLLNQTNLKALIAIFGADDQQWIGQAVELHAAAVDIRGQMTKGVRLRQIPLAPAQQVVQQPVQQTPPQQAVHQPAQQQVVQQQPPAQPGADAPFV